MPLSSSLYCFIRCSLVSYFDDFLKIRFYYNEEVFFYYLELFFSRLDSLSGSYFAFLFLFFFLNNVCMVVMLIILILFVPDIESTVQFLTLK